ncbi:nucleotidyltransferase family protein [Pseudomonas sp. TTU2014-080ASC]|uniref:nucleotidyltransferase family protein n=1 Tax=Pseudomonas sp. TTU2014-080ASC TaxID=1729724 RepID=UPI000718A58D|nr:nucleotidyltransferase family protein [Pseudomonas sp. TTU2014-080ASC]KRW62146.1 molybdopterin-guanine dinucleotide biosynthesis protein MobA [Pseudomonas sp. TTU2014-080ASC]
MIQPPCVVILAAGQGSRYRQVAGEGQNKLLADCHGLDGVVRPVLEQVLINLPACLPRRVVVTLPEYVEVMALVERYGCQVLPLVSAGMGQSIATAVRATADASGWLIMLGDMPFIQTQTIEQVAAALSTASAAVAQMHGRMGHPVGFGSVHTQALIGLSGDRGARALLLGADVQVVSVNDPGIFWDIDEPHTLGYAPE